MQSSRSIVDDALLLLDSDQPLLVTTSLSDAVLATVMSMLDAPHRLVFVDTGYHFSETIHFLESVQRHLSVAIERVSAMETRDVHEQRLGP